MSKQNNTPEKEIEFLKAELKVCQTIKNQGDRDELLCQMELLHLNQTGQYDKLVEICGEESSDGIKLNDVTNNNKIEDINNIFKKTAPSYKSDFSITMNKTGKKYNISLKSKNGNPPTILNHTPRTAKIFKEGGILHDCLPCLDEVVKEYLYKRNNRIIGEDTPITNLTCLDDNDLKEKFIYVVSFFIFEGTGKGYSKARANSVIEYSYDKTTFIICEDIEQKKRYIESIYDRIIISLRDKCMPKELNEYCKPWVFDEIKSNGSIKHKGSLHLRLA